MPRKKGRTRSRGGMDRAAIPGAPGGARTRPWCALRCSLAACTTGAAVSWPRCSNQLSYSGGNAHQYADALAPLPSGLVIGDPADAREVAETSREHRSVSAVDLRDFKPVDRATTQPRELREVRHHGTVAPTQLHQGLHEPDCTSLLVARGATLDVRLERVSRSKAASRSARVVARATGLSGGSSTVSLTAPLWSEAMRGSFLSSSDGSL